MLRRRRRRDQSKINMESSYTMKTKISSLLAPKRSHHSAQQQQKIILKGTMVILQNHGQSLPAKSVSLQIYSGTEVDPNTGKGKLSERAELKHERRKKHEDGTQSIITYKMRVNVDLDFGIPSAFVIKNNGHKNRFFLQSASIQTPNNNQILHFDCNSWIYPFKYTKSHRLFFSNTCYVGSETPRALVELRKEELGRMRGNDELGEKWKEWERRYEYEVYNDLGDPDYGSHHLRPVLGASSSFPYPRRLRTGRQPTSTKPSIESRPESIIWSIYVPPDERCSPRKLKELQENSVQAIVHFLIPEAKSLFEHNSHSFQSFEEIINMFSGKRNQRIEGRFKERMKNILVHELHKAITHASHKTSVQYPLPQIISEDECAWMDDMEFGRQMLAGVHPVRIQRLKRFPPQSKNGVYSSIKPSDIEQNLDGCTLQLALQQRRIFILDHHDYLIPFLNRINKNGVCAYASRTLLFLRDDDMLKPIAIELSLSGLALGSEIHRVFLPAKEGVEAALWQLAKAHVAANDTLYHQLISHWLHTHAVVEPFIIATRRQLSVMHPIHRMLNPHFRDTIHINALARCIIVNSEGMFEKTLLSSEISMALSSELYKEWRFYEQGLPADLLKRGVAIKDTNVNNPTGIQLLLEDYPYATDGLEIWVSIKQWVNDFCSFFYKDDNAVTSDVELQAWWAEIRDVGHGDKRNELWWNQMTTLPNLVEALTTLIWIASALHASLNYGQYAYCGYPPARPTLCRKFIPQEGTPEFGEFLKDPDKFFLQMLPGRFETSLAVALVHVLSRHASDEVYLGCQPSSEWIDNEEVRKRFAQFNEELKKIQTRILSRNNDHKLKNRRGPAKMAYNLLCPDISSSGSKGVIMGRGIPNSISI